MRENTLEELVKNAELLLASNYYDIETATPYIRPIRRPLAKALQCSESVPHHRRGQDGLPFQRQHLRP